jgi:cell division inhibitor SulA/protein ImuA
MSSVRPEQATGAASLDSLLQHPALWRGRQAATRPTLSSGSPLLDAQLPSGGWPAGGLIEILTQRAGLGELRLLLPLLRRVGQQSPARWVVWVAPPFEPYAPALQAYGMPLSGQLVIRTTQTAWALEQALESGACAVALCWGLQASVAQRAQILRRLQWGAQRSGLPVFLFRDWRALREPSTAELRLIFEPLKLGGKVQLIKSRGVSRTPCEFLWSQFERATDQAPLSEVPLR